MYAGKSIIQRHFTKKALNIYLFFYTPFLYFVMMMLTLQGRHLDGSTLGQILFKAEIKKKWHLYPSLSHMYVELTSFQASLLPQIHSLPSERIQGVEIGSLSTSSSI